jgi:hypothetical protein
VLAVLALPPHQAQVEQLARQEEIPYSAQSLPLVVAVVRLIVHLLALMEQVVVLAAVVEALLVGLPKQVGLEILQVYRHRKAITAALVGLEILPT